MDSACIASTTLQQVVLHNRTGRPSASTTPRGSAGASPSRFLRKMCRWSEFAGFEAVFQVLPTAAPPKFRLPTIYRVKGLKIKNLGNIKLLHRHYRLLELNHGVGGLDFSESCLGLTLEIDTNYRFLAYL